MGAVWKIRVKFKQKRLHFFGLFFSFNDVDPVVVDVSREILCCCFSKDLPGYSTEIRALLNWT